MARGYCTTRSWSVTRTMEAPRSRTSKKTRAMSTPMGNSQACPEPQARAGSWAASRRAKNDKVKAAAATPRPSSRAVPSTVRRFDGSDDHIRNGTSRSVGQGSGAGRPSPRPLAGVGLLAGLAPQIAQPADRVAEGAGRPGHGPDDLGPGPDDGGLVVAGRGLGLGLGLAGLGGLGGVGWLLVEADAGGGEQGRQQGHHRVLGQRPGQPPRAVAAVDGQQGHHRGGQGDGQQARAGQAGGGVVVVQDLNDDGQEAGHGHGRPPPTAQRAGSVEGGGAGVDQRRPPGEGGLGPAGGWLAPADARVHEHAPSRGVGGGRRVRPRVGSGVAPPHRGPEVGHLVRPADGAGGRGGRRVRSSGCWRRGRRRPWNRGTGPGGRPCRTRPRCRRPGR